MKNHKGCIRGYYRASKSYYYKNGDAIEIYFGLYAKNGKGGGTELSMKWKELGGILCAKLSSFYDSWDILASFDDLIKKLSEVSGKSIQEEDFARILDECGFKDMTSYKNPYLNVPKEEMIKLSIPKAQAKKLGLIK